MDVNLKHIGIAIAAFGLTLVAIDKSVQYVVIPEVNNRKIGFDTEKEENDKVEE